MTNHTEHNIIIGNSQKMTTINDDTVDIIVTSPPYPMIQMWDEMFINSNPKINVCLASNPIQAFELMHKELDIVWEECYRVLKNGGYLCINIGNATRTINGQFSLYNNQSRVAQKCQSLGLNSLPYIIWRKQTNAPNKFMGSGMLPCGAYMTLEHEYILIFRKGEKRRYSSSEEKKLRRESAFFWEERNQWFSDVWDIKGVKQTILTDSRNRSAAFPFEIAYRLINMYSQKNDIVLDPFLGTGTTTIASIASERNSIGIEIDPNMALLSQNEIASIDISEINSVISNRIDRHNNFVSKYINSGKTLKYFNTFFKCAVMTKQEVDMSIRNVTNLSLENSTNDMVKFIINYEQSR